MCCSLNDKLWPISFSDVENHVDFLEIKHGWTDVQSSLEYNYKFPGEVTPYMKEQYSRPSVYRWMVWRPAYGVNAYYVGETDDLTNRIKQYLRPGKTQATNLRLKAYFDEAAKRDESVELQMLNFEPFQINKVTFSMDLLGPTHVRRTFENLLLVWLHADVPSGPPLILNRVFAQDMERSKNRAEAALAALKKLGLTDEETKHLVEALKVTKARA